MVFGTKLMGLKLKRNTTLDFKIKIYQETKLASRLVARLGGQSKSSICTSTKNL